MRIMGWNYRGVGGPRAVRSLCDVVKSHRPSIVGLIETKKNDGRWEPLRCRLGLKGCVAVDSRGDFNEVAYSWEMKSKRARQLWQMRKFRRCLEDCELSEIWFRGEPYTYSNKRKGEQEVRARLDRAVANISWLQTFPLAVVKHGFANSSDHVPVILYTEDDKQNQPPQSVKI
ncbi:hypothetical protein QQ045_001511 [Rhodiola kirilowii]